MIQRRWITLGFRVCIVMFAMSGSAVSIAQESHAIERLSAIELLSGFDRARIEAAYPPSDPAAAGELAKLVYRLQSVDANVLAERVATATDPSIGVAIGNAVAIDGEIESIDVIDVPEKLVEFLEFKRLRSVVVRGDNDATSVVTANLPSDAVVGDRVRGTGIVIESTDGHADAVAAARLSWFPSRPPSVGWQLLSSSGVDVSLLADVSTRNHKPLVAADAEAFYSVMAASDAIGRQSNPPQTDVVSAVQLLTDPKPMVGQWIQLEVETVQVTRIAVTDPSRREQLGSDRYFQIDAVADLGSVVIKIEASDENGGAAATFENRYPVSIVALELPPFLNETIWKQSGTDAVIADISRQVAIDGFFFRLWSYQSEYMKRFGGDDQFGPLVIAAKIIDRTPTSGDPVGVAIIGWFAMVAVFVGLIGTFIWHRYTSSGDEAISELRKKKQPETIDFD